MCLDALAACCCSKWMEWMGGWVDVSTHFQNNHSPALMLHSDIWNIVGCCSSCGCYPFAALRRCFNRFQFGIEPFSAMLCKLITEKIAMKYNTAKAVMAHTHTLSIFGIFYANTLLPCPSAPHLVLLCDEIPYFRILFLISFQCCEISAACRWVSERETAYYC